MCVNADGDYEKTFQNAIELTAFIMKRYTIPLTNVVRHYDSSQVLKHCPRSMYANNWEKWSVFLTQVRDLNIRNNLVPKWKSEPVKEMIRQGILTDKRWLAKIDEPMPVWAVCTMFDRMIEKYPFHK